jgi:hypothetical protein
MDSVPLTKKSKITKHNKFWLYVDDEMLILSSCKTDKEFMLSKDKKNV